MLTLREWRLASNKNRTRVVRQTSSTTMEETQHPPGCAELENESFDYGKWIDDVAEGMDMDLALALSLSLQEQRNEHQGGAGHSENAQSNELAQGEEGKESSASQVPQGLDQLEASEGDTQRKTADEKGKSNNELVQSDDESKLPLSVSAQNDEQLAIAQANEESKHAMNSSFSGKAWNFVQTVIEEHQSPMMDNTAAMTTLKVETVGTDDMLIMVERLLEAQFEFSRKDKDTQVDIGYHYTRSENLEKIKENGLLSKAERQECGVISNYNGSAWGDGIYSANQPYAYQNFGPIGLLVARLKGSSRPATRGGRGFIGDTAIANAGCSNEIVILAKSYQCIPLVQFQRLDRPDDAVEKALQHIHGKLQEIVDVFLNNRIKTDIGSLERPHTVRATVPYRRATPCRKLRKVGSAIHPRPSAVDTKVPGLNWYQVWKATKSGPVPTSESNWEHARSSPYKSETYRKSSTQSLESSKNLPSGSMRISYYSKETLVCDTVGTIVIIHAFQEEDTLKMTNHVEYIPDKQENRDILERLKFAYCSGAIHPDTLIPRRISPFLPFPDYALVCGKALDVLGIPEASQCDSSSHLVASRNKILDEVKQKPCPKIAARPSLNSGNFHGFDECFDLMASTNKALAEGTRKPCHEN